MFGNFYPSIDLNYRLLYDIFNVCYTQGLSMLFFSILPADVLWGSLVTHSFLPHGGGGEMNA